MKTVTRGLRALLRNPLRSGLLAALLTVSISLTLVMITVDSAFGKRMDDVKNEVGSNVTVSVPNNFVRGMFGDTTETDTTEDEETVTLTNEQAESIADIEHVTSLNGELSEFDIDTTLTAPELTLPEGMDLPEGADMPDTSEFEQTVGATGYSDPASIVGTGDTGTALASGRIWTSDESDSNVAIISDSIAEANALEVGSTFTIGDETIEVIGITSGGTSFGRAASIFLPLTTAQRVFDRSGELTTISLEVDDIANVEAVATTVSDRLGSDYDVSTSADTYDQIAGTLQDARNSSRLALVVSALSAALVILFGIVLAARQRIKEIGVMKAIGAANSQVVAQFGVETLVIGLTAGILGALITFPIAQSVADGLISSDSSSGGPGRGGGGGAFFSAAQGAGNAAGGVLGGVDVAVSPVIFVYALLFAGVLAVIASIGPAWQVARVRPAEVLRHD
ncbi:hypothetical protein BH09CHL1_BH09CHL1_08710 [soil metagenome]